MDLLFLAHRVPFPPDRGDKIRSWHILRHLAARVRVHLIAFTDDEDADEAPPAGLLASCTLIPRRKSQARAAIEALATGQPLSLAAFADPAMAKAVAEVLASQPIETIYVFSGQMAQYLPPKPPRVVMDFVDMDSAKFGAFADAAGLPMQWMMRREARLLGAFERDVSARVDASVFVSEPEAALFRAGGGQGRIVGIENGIDARFYDPAFPPIAEAGPLLVFTGQMDYRPNTEAVRWFVADILPRIRESCPVRFAIVGRSPTEAVQALAGDHVIVTGAVPDVRGWLAAATVCVAPLRLARGIQNKVLEAMAMARPVVASTAAAEGIDHAGTIRVAADARGFAEQVVALIADPGTIGVEARARVLHRYDWDSRLAGLSALIGLPEAQRTAA